MKTGKKFSIVLLGPISVGMTSFILSFCDSKTQKEILSIISDKRYGY